MKNLTIRQIWELKREARKHPDSCICEPCIVNLLEDIEAAYRRWLQLRVPYIMKEIRSDPNRPKDERLINARSAYA